MPNQNGITKVGGRTAIVSCASDRFRLPYLTCRRQVGVGSRAQMYLKGVVDRMGPDSSNKVVAFCDKNIGRVQLYNRFLEELGQPVSRDVLLACRYSLLNHRLLERRKPPNTPRTASRRCSKRSRSKSWLSPPWTRRTTSSSVSCTACTAWGARTQHTLWPPAVPSLKRGIRVVTEKPMTTDIEKCRSILRAVKETDNHLTVTFNYRFNPVHEAVKKLLASGTIGEVLSVHFEWTLIAPGHGTDYARRWHRNKANSGGMMVHKSGHHFDLVGGMEGESIHWG